VNEVDSLFRTLDGLPELVHADLAQVAQDAARMAAAMAPLRTGRLRANVYAERPAAGQFLITAAVPYASYVIFGTRYVRAHPFLQVAVARELEQFDLRLAEQLGVDRP
jgi:hypothetical protein